MSLDADPALTSLSGQMSPPAPTASRGAHYRPVGYDELPGWATDNHAAAFRAFVRSCAPLLAAAHRVAAADPSSPMLAACRRAIARAARRPRRSEARAFFEHFFCPHRVVRDGGRGLLTGYYEPVLPGSRTPTAEFTVPVYRRPPDLENIVAETARAAAGNGLTHARRTPAGLMPFPTRAEIEAGALDGQGLELLWLNDAVDAFFMHVQGSGRIRLPDGALVRLTYDGKNGHPYTSVGRYLIDRKVMGASSMTLQSLGAWLRADPARARDVMWQNKSYVFFRELPPAEASARGALEVPLTPGRSLAVDPAFHALGLPVYVSAPTLRHAEPSRPFQRLMVAQDVGSAIKGPERGDIYFGSGPRAGAAAGITKHPGRFFVLLPRVDLAPCSGEA